MHFIWKVEVERSQDCAEWISEIGQILEIDYLINGNFTINQSDENEARNWYKSMYNVLLDIPLNHGLIKPAFITLNEGQLDLIRIFPRFARYEQKSFLLLLFKYQPFDSNNDLSITFLKELQDQIEPKLNEKYSDSKIKWHFSVRTKIEEYEELLMIRNPIPLLSCDEFPFCQLEDKWKKIMGDGYCRMFQIAYPQGRICLNDKLTRIYDLIYILNQNIDYYFDTEDKRNNTIDIIHTEILFFIRGMELEKETAADFHKNLYLKKATDIVGDLWPMLRTLFLIIPRFSLLRKNDGSTLFFNILELNAQLSSLLNCIKLNLRNNDIVFEERFERQQFTIQRLCSEEEIEYFAKLQQRVCYSFEANSNKVQIIDSYTNALDAQISKLQTSFDSNTSYMLQILMFWLSIFILGWGAIALGYDKLICSVGKVLDNPPIIAAALFFIVILSFLMITKVYLNKNSNPIDKDSTNVLDKWLNNWPKRDLDMKDNKVLDTYIDKIDSEKKLKEKINVVIELIIIVTAGVTLGAIDVNEGIGYLDKIKEKLIS